MAFMYLKSKTFWEIVFECFYYVFRLLNFKVLNFFFVVSLLFFFLFDSFHALEVLGRQWMSLSI